MRRPLWPAPDGSPDSMGSVLGSCGGTFISRSESTSSVDPVERQTQAQCGWPEDLDLKEFFRQVPKAELHLHLDGSVRPFTILELAREQGLTKTASGRTIPDTTDEIRGMVEIGLDCPDLETYLSTFDLTCSVLQTASALSRVVVEIAEDAANDGIVYLELRFSPLLHRAKGLTMMEVIAAVLDGREHAELLYPIRVQFLLCGIRTMPESEVCELADVAWRFRNRGVCGFDLAGAEKQGPAARYQKAFDQATKQMLNVTIHAGEADGWQSVHDAIQVCAAQRVGHGCNMAENEALMRHAAFRQVAVEVCVTSNAQTKAIAGLEMHPLRRFLGEGIPCVPCVDNAVVSSTSLSTEYLLCVRHYALSPVQVAAMLDSGFQYSFAGFDTRRVLREAAAVSTLRLFRGKGIATGAVEAELRGRLPRLFFRALPASRGAGEGAQGGGGGKRILEEEEWLQVLQQVPLPDCGCCLVGCVPAETLLEELRRLREAEEGGKEAEAAAVRRRARLHRGSVSFTGDCWQPSLLAGVETARELAAFFRGAAEDAALDAMAQLLQTEEQLQRGVGAILAQAQHDGVRYLELVVRPALHVLGGLSAAEVVAVTCAAVGAFRGREGARVEAGVVLQFNPAEDGTEVSEVVAEAATGGQGAVVGVYVGWDGDAESLRRHGAAIAAMKASYVPVSLRMLCLLSYTQRAGVLSGLREVGACRLVCKDKIMDYPGLVDFLSRRKVAVACLYDQQRLHLETLDTPSAELDGPPAEEWAAPIRMLAGAGVPLVMGSARSTPASLQGQEMGAVGAGGEWWRGKGLARTLAGSQLEVVQGLMVVVESFRRNFAPYHVRQRLAAEFWDAALAAALPGHGPLLEQIDPLQQQPGRAPARGLPPPPGSA